MRRRSRFAVALIALAVLALSGGAGRRRADPERQPDRLARRRHQPAQAPRDTNGPRSRSISPAGSTPRTNSPLPRVDRLKLELAWRGLLFTRGLPVCPQVRLRGIDSRQALAACGGALVGRGSALREDLRPEPGAVRDPGQPAGLQRQDQGGAAGGPGPRLHDRPARLVRDPIRGPPPEGRLPHGSRDHPETIGRDLAARLQLPDRDRAQLPLPRQAPQLPERAPARCRRNSPPASSPSPAPRTPSPGGEELAIESVRSCRARKKGGTRKAQRHVGRATTPHPDFPLSSGFRSVAAPPGPATND